MDLLDVVVGSSGEWDMVWEGGIRTFVWKIHAWWWTIPGWMIGLYYRYDDFVSNFLHNIFEFIWLSGQFSFISVNMFLMFLSCIWNLSINNTYIHTFISSNIHFSFSLFVFCRCCFCLSCCNFLILYVLFIDRFQIHDKNIKNIFT